MRRLLYLCVSGLVLFGCAKVDEVATPSAPETTPEGLVWYEALPASPGVPVTVYAGLADGSETRSRIAREGSTAKVLWTAGDSFQTIFSVDGGGYNSATFTTQDDGVTEAAFTTTSALDGTAFHCYYPKTPARWGAYQGEPVFSGSIPVVQTAVAGGIEEGLNVAYAYADKLTKNLDEPLKFYNLPSLLKFRLEGAVVSQVKEITLSGSETLAGDQVFRLEDGVPKIFPGISYSEDVHSPKVTLKGDFETGTDYYIVLFPQKMSWFRMEFSDGQGNFTVKQSVKPVEFERSRVKDIGTINLGDEFADVDDGSLDPVLYMAATEGTKPVTIAVIPEGFTKEELSQYELLAKSGINTLFETEPYKTYRNRFNVYILKVASLESGASITDGNGNITTPVSSFFGARWGATTYSDMRANDATVFNFVSEKCPDIVNGTHTIAEVPILMIINDSRFGGMCWSYSNGQAYAMVPYTDHGEGLHWTHPELTPVSDDPLPESATDLGEYYRSTTQEEYNQLGTNYGDWRNTLVHEFGGHGIGRLGDEYWSSPNRASIPVSRQDWPVPFSLNLAAAPAEASWKETLLDRLDELVARDARYGRIGTFQGGDGYMFGRWRSERISCMIDNRFYFSAWQRYLITQRIFTLSGDAGSFNFSTWLANDVPLDPVRDATSSGTPGAREHKTYRDVGPLPPPGFVDI